MLLFLLQTTFWMLLRHCFTVLTGQQVKQTTHKHFLTAALGRKSSMLISKLLTQLPLVFIKPSLFLAEFAWACLFT